MVNKKVTARCLIQCSANEGRQRPTGCGSDGFSSALVRALAVVGSEMTTFQLLRRTLDVGSGPLAASRAANLRKESVHELNRYSNIIAFAIMNLSLLIHRKCGFERRM